MLALLHIQSLKLLRHPSPSHICRSMCTPFLESGQSFHNSMHLIHFNTLYFPVTLTLWMHLIHHIHQNKHHWQLTNSPVKIGKISWPKTMCLAAVECPFHVLLLFQDYSVWSSHVHKMPLQMHACSLFTSQLVCTSIDSCSFAWKETLCPFIVFHC